MRLSKKSFTLMELLIVIAIIAILAAIVLVSLDSAKQRAVEARGMSFSQNIRNTLSVDTFESWDFDSQTNPGQGYESKIDATAYNGSTACNYDPGPPATGCPTIVPGIKRNGLKLDGVNDHIVVLISSPRLNNNLTINFWVKPESGTCVVGITGAGEFSISFDLGSSKRLIYTHGSGTSSNYSCMCDNMIDLNKWQLITVTRSISEQKIGVYKNGEKRNCSCSPTWTNPGVTSGSNLDIGHGTCMSYFKGTIDDLQIYTGSISK